MTAPIPVIDIAPWFAGDSAVRSALAAEVGAACENVGFLVIDGHGINPAVIAAAFGAAQDFFAQPMDDKLEVHFAKSGVQLGYIPPKAERSDQKGAPDLKEAFDLTHVVAPQPGDDPITARMYGPNLWPAALPSVRTACEAYLAEMIGLGRAQMRLMRYPVEPEARIGIGAHTDYEFLTLVAQDDVGGLEVRTRDGTWATVPPRPGSFVMNLGEMMARWTNGRFRATPHRVWCPVTRNRYSVPFFFGPNYETEIVSLHTCTSAERPPRYPAITAGRYLAERLAAQGAGT
jgi:isopenicillin N synthase-like dioxygenase